MSLQQSAPQSRRRAERGFTLLELMVVVGILGVLAAIVVPNLFGEDKKAKIKITKQTILQTETIMGLYKLDVGSFPSNDQGLQALLDKPSDAPNWGGPYVKTKKLPADAWNKPFLYRVPSSRADHDYDLCSYGPKGTPGGAGEDAEICNE